MSSRGGLKLDAALDTGFNRRHGQSVHRYRSLTGGFTDCLLQRGAARVIRRRCRTDQLDWEIRSIRGSSCKNGHECALISHLPIFSELCDLAVCDVSFISVTLILRSYGSVANEDGEMVILVKPQFEVGRRSWQRRNRARPRCCTRRRATRCRTLLESLGFRTEMIDSPIRGAKETRNSSSMPNPLRPSGCLQAEYSASARDRSCAVQWLRDRNIAGCGSMSRPAFISRSGLYGKAFVTELSTCVDRTWRGRNPLVSRRVPLRTAETSRFSR